MSIRDDVIESLKALPTDASPEDIEYHVYIALLLERRLADENAERLTDEEAREQLKRWLN